MLVLLGRNFHAACLLRTWAIIQQRESISYRPPRTGASNNRALCPPSVAICRPPAPIRFGCERTRAGLLYRGAVCHPELSCRARHVMTKETGAQRPCIVRLGARQAKTKSAMVRASPSLSVVLVKGDVQTGGGERLDRPRRPR